MPRLVFWAAQILPDAIDWLSEEHAWAPNTDAVPPVVPSTVLQFITDADPAQMSPVRQMGNDKQGEALHIAHVPIEPLLRGEPPKGTDSQTTPAAPSAQADMAFVESNQFFPFATGEPVDLSSVIENADEIQIEAISNDPGYLKGTLWNMEGDQTTIKNQYGSQAGEAWAAGYIGNMKTVVGVVDTGIDYTHIDLYLNIWLNQGEIPASLKSQLKDIDGDGLITFRDLNDRANSAFVTDKNGNNRIDAGDLLKDIRWADGNDQDRNGFIDDLIGWDFYNNDNDPFDDNGHGTHVAGTIGALGGNSAGVAGVNWNVQLVATKVLSAKGSGSSTEAVKALNYYTDASKLAPQSENFVATNNSWGGGSSNQDLLDAITAAAKADILFIAAAGNNSANNDIKYNYPSNYDTKATAGYDAVISVASITSTGELSSFSDYGKTQVDIGAPGSSIYSTLPGDAYGTMSGTSMAAPMVTGAAALYASSHPTATAAEIKAAILGSVDLTVSLSGMVATNGRLDVSNLMAGIATPPAVTPGETVKILTVLDNVGSSQGNIQVGGTTDDTTPTLQGTLSAALSDGEFLAVYHNGIRAGLATVSGTNWSFTEGSNLVAATWSFTARVESIAGTAGSYSAAYNITIDLGPNYIYGTAGNDSRAGTAGRDIMSGLPASGDYMGKGSIDKLTGGAGNDIFLLGDSRGVFYDDGVSSSAGTTDYVQVMDFQPGDQIQLSRKASGYLNVAVTIGGRSGLGIYVDSNGNQRFDTTDELIGHIVGVSNLTPADILWA